MHELSDLGCSGLLWAANLGCSRLLWASKLLTKIHRLLLFRKDDRVRVRVREGELGVTRVKVGVKCDVDRSDLYRTEHIRMDRGVCPFTSVLKCTEGARKCCILQHGRSGEYAGQAVRDSQYAV